MQQAFNILLIVMAVLAVVVFIALFFVDAGYGMLLNRKWGKTVSNKVGWFVMESPVFLLMTVLWLMSDRRFEAAPLCFLFLFQLHYFQRAFIFPFLLKGRGRMPLAIIAMGILFNMVNAVMQGGWIFYLAPEGLYTSAWLKTPQFIVGTAVFIAGMVINIHSDHIIRNLRRPGDTAHHIPYGGMFRWVSSANYFGDLVKKETGKSAQEYIQLKVIDIAKERMFDTTKSISEIAYELGFRYPQHFTRLFKKCVGMSPNEYRTTN